MVMRECEVPCFWVSELMFLRAIGYSWTVASSCRTESQIAGWGSGTDIPFRCHGHFVENLGSARHLGVDPTFFRSILHLMFATSRWLFYRTSHE